VNLCSLTRTGTFTLKNFTISSCPGLQTRQRLYTKTVIIYVTHSDALNNSLILPIGELIELCDVQSKCFKSKEFTSQFITWSANDKFVLSAMIYNDSRTGIHGIKMKNHRPIAIFLLSSDLITVTYDSLRRVQLGAYSKQFVLWFSIKMELQGIDFFILI
jgi:hypothetical protein